MSQPPDRELEYLTEESGWMVNEPEEVRKNIILELSLDFSVSLLEFSNRLQGDMGKIISKQLMRSGTSVGANIREAQDAESRADFFHKMKLAGKEARETHYWLEICSRVSSLPNPGELLSDIVQIQKILNRILSTSKANSSGNKTK